MLSGTGIKDDAEMLEWETDEIFFRNIYHRIGEIRREKGITQEQLAAKAIADPKEIQRWETIGGLSLKTLRKLSKALECPIVEFFKVPKTKRPLRGLPRKKTRNTDQVLS